MLRIEITNLEVRVTATAGVRGSMAMDPAVPVGFQGMRCDVMFAVKAGTPPELLKKLQMAAERCCVVQQTLKAPPVVETTFIDSDAMCCVDQLNPPPEADY